MQPHSFRLAEYLQGRSHFEKWTSEDLKAAVEFFSNAGA